MRPEGEGRVSWRAFFLRMAVCLWLFEVGCQIVLWLTE